MDKETIRYIRNYFSHLITADELLALKHSIFLDKSSDNERMRELMLEKGWISTDPEITGLLKDGYDEFELRIVKRILAETPDKVYFNNCPKCRQLARTPYAKQCRFCGYSWHHLTVGVFHLKSAFQVTNRQFFLAGELTSGEVKEGQFIDLTVLGLNKKPRIEAVEFALKRQDGEVYEDIALGTSELTEEDKQFLKELGTSRKPIDILTER